MKSGRGFLSLFDSLTDRILCVVGAVLFSQGPEFMQQYLQRLGGHLDEARRQLATFQKTADQAGLTLDQFISQTAANADSAVAKLGGVMSDSVDRVASLQSAHDALLSAALWERPFVFVRQLDPSIARATAGVYQPAVPTTAEGLVYALAGMLIILALYHLGLKRLFGLVFTRSSAPATARAGA
ncbi:DUF2937 family protein [Oleiharenicola lentus]|uniref:DUF2937 family protein n=1 Tax=Oleiharenicola lentus TaxID=2508720 RepID=A0A4Q1C4I5_9BACT|nr:DUF2937 family protein [Oleiharenicola lentus]RXK53179.1 DUF2937 family protein [Oleiharenicola lentus]